MPQPVNRFHTLLVGILLLGVTALLVALGQLRSFDHDEFEAMHTTWKMFTGQEIYVDFIQHHHPFTYYVLEPLYGIFGADTPVLLAGRMLMVGMLLLTLLVTYLIALELYKNRLVAATSALFLACFVLFLDKMIEIRPDVPMSLLALLGAYFALRALRTRAWWLFALSGASFGLALMFLQKAIVLLLGIGLVLLVRLFTKKLRFSDLVIFGVAVLAPVVPYGIYLVLSDKLETFIFYNFTYNTLYYRLRGWELYKLVANVGAVYKYNIIVVLLFFYVTFFMRKERREWESLFLIASVLGFTLLTGRHNPQYYILAFPFMAVLAARAFWTLLTPRPVIAALLLAFVVYGPLERYYTVFLVPQQSNSYQLARIERVLALTDPDDYVYDGNIQFNLFRRDIDFIWYMAGEPYKAVQTLETLIDYEYDIYESIERFEPKIINAFGIDDMAHPVIAEHYKPDSQFTELYVRQE